MQGEKNGMNKSLIDFLKKERGSSRKAFEVTSVDVADWLGVTREQAHGALRYAAKKGLVSKTKKVRENPCARALVVYSYPGPLA